MLREGGTALTELRFNPGDDGGDPQIVIDLDPTEFGSGGGATAEPG
jgi:hypothetical protein